MATDGKTAKNTGRILSIVVFNAITYLLIGLPLAVFPGIVHFKLGYSATLAGGGISLQYLATLLTRSVVGRISDLRGGKIVALGGLGFAALNGVCILAAGFAHAPLFVLGWLLLSRLMLGAAESGTGTGCNTWGIGLFGPSSMADVMSWNGVASYGGIAAGAPIGVALLHLGGLRAIAALAIALPLLGLVVASFRPASHPLANAKRMSLFKVVRYVWLHGAALACGTFGFGSIVAFMALYYAAHGWHGAAYALTSFGLAFILVRVVLTGVIGRFGGFRPALISLAVEITGLITLWLAPVPGLALVGAALAGLGASLLFPALGVEALKIVEPGSRGGAIAIYSVFLDIALGLTGPLAGLVAGHLGYSAVFCVSALAVGAGLGLTWLLYARDQRRPVQSL